MKMAYENIQKLLNKPGEGLSTQQQADNYDLFNKLMKEGVYLPDIIKKIDALEKKVDEMDKPRDNPIDAELFAVMESAVRDDSAVSDARRRLQAEKTRVISALCIADDGYRKAFEDYRRAVNAAYVNSRESDDGKKVEAP